MGSIGTRMAGGCLAFAVLCGAGAPSFAEDTTLLGTGRLFSNDLIGDGQDRWQTGSYVVSKLRGPANWDGTPQPFGTIREYRLRSAIVASDNRGLTPDRPYAGTLSFGVHSHFGAGTTQATLGFDVTAVGPQTGLADFQETVHEVVGLPEVQFVDGQKEDDFLFGITAETAELVALPRGTILRPFGEVQIGPEHLVRVGADLFFGQAIPQDILVRDVTTGQLYPGTASQSEPGLGFVLGADMATLTESAFLPDSGPGQARQSRARVRAGVHLQTASRGNLFYGLTYLSPEFSGQDEGQILGSVKLSFNF